MKTTTDHFVATLSLISSLDYSDYDDHLRNRKKKKKAKKNSTIQPVNKNSQASDRSSSSQSDIIKPREHNTSTGNNFSDTTTTTSPQEGPRGKLIRSEKEVVVASTSSEQIKQESVDQQYSTATQSKRLITAVEHGTLVESVQIIITPL